MFRREDYWPYMFGVFVFGGLIAIPIIWGQFIELPYGQHVALSLVGCLIFAYAHTRDGIFSFGRFIKAFVFILVLSFGIVIRSRVAQVFIPGGILGFLVMGASGWIGIGLARVLGISQALRTLDPPILPTFGGSGTSLVMDAKAVAAYSFTDDLFRHLIQNTYEAWKEGKLSHLSEEFEKTAEVKSLDEFITLFRSARNAIKFAFFNSPPEESEYLVCAQDAGVRQSFVLTNKYFYFFGLDLGVLANKYETGRVALKNIRRCTLNEGQVFNRATLTLTSGRGIDLRDLMTPAPVKFIMKILEAH